MFTVFVYLYLFHYSGGTVLLGFVFLFTSIIELYFSFCYMHKAGYVLYIDIYIYIFPFEVDIVFLVVAGKHDAVPLDFRMSFLLSSFDQFNK